MQSAARVVALAFLAALAGCESMSNPAQQTPDPGNRTAAVESVPGQYIVVLQDNVADPATVARDLVSSAGGSLLHVYTSAIKGFAAQLSAPAAAALEGNPLVAYVEADQVVRADVTQAMDANGDPWGLDRIDQHALALSGTYTYTSTGAGVDVRRHCRRRLGQRKPSQSGRGQHVAGRRCFEFAEPGGDQSLELRGV